MRDFQAVSAAQALAQRHQYQRIIDVRSPSEYLLDCFPGAVSHCVLDDEQRVRIGTLNKQVSPFEAKRVGAALVARNIAAMLEHGLHDLNRQDKVLVYCWRGGNRSASLGTILARIGYPVEVIEGGYKAYRKAVVEAISARAPALSYKVLVGRTGSGKSLLLQAMAAQGAQVLDLEALARHKGSVLGLAPGDVQPSQKKFESLLWEQLSGFDPARPVHVESESRKIGQCQVPEALIEAMRASPCIDIVADIDTRVALLKAEYPHFMQEGSSLFGRLDALLSLHGHERIDAWKAQAQAGDWDGFVRSLLEEHYDPAYDRSITRNFKRHASAQRQTLSLAQGEMVEQALPVAIRDCATALLALP